jgi:hypothetical protein
LLPIEYLTPFRHELFYDPDIVVNTLFDITSDNKAAVIAGAVVGSLVGVAIIGVGVAILVSPKFRAKMTPFSNRNANYTEANEQQMSPEAKSAWQPGHGGRAELRNTADSH